MAEQDPISDTCGLVACCPSPMILVAHIPMLHLFGSKYGSKGFKLQHSQCRHAAGVYVSGKIWRTLIVNYVFCEVKAVLKVGLLISNTEHHCH